MLYPLCDILYTLTRSLNLAVNFNQMIRGLGLILFISCISDEKHFIKTAIATMLIVFSFAYNTIIGISTSMTTDIANTLKVINNFVILYAFIDLYKKGKVNFEEVSRWLIISSYIVVASILISYLGIGLESYAGSGRSGVKGFFTIQSTITLYLLLILPLYYYKYRNLISLQMLLCVAALFSIGSKTGVFGTILEYIVFFVFDLKLANRGKRLSRKRLITYACIIICAMTGGVYGIWHYIQYLINLYHSKAYYYSLEAFLLSNRNDHITWITQCIENLKYGEGNVAGILFGYSYSGVASLVKSAGYKFEALERDFHGIYYYNGILVLSILILVLVSLLRKMMKNNLKSRFSNLQSLTIILIFCVGIIYAFLGGHLFYEAMNQIPFWIVTANIYFNPSITENKKNGNVGDYYEKNRYFDISQSI